MSSSSFEKVKVNDVEVDFTALKLFVDNRWQDIEAKQILLLRLLIEHQGQAVSRNQIMNCLWQDTIVSDNSVSQAVTQLRRSLGDDKGTPKFIKTVPRVGYQLIAELEFPEITEPERRLQEKNKKQSIVIAIASAVFAIVATLMLIKLSVPTLKAPSYQYESRLTSTPGPESYLRYSPNGRYLAFSQISEDRRHMDLAVYDAKTQSVHTIKNTGYSEEAPEWSPDGNWLVYFRHDPFSCEIRVMSVQKPIETWRISPDRHLSYCEAGYSRQKIHWSSDNTLYYQSWQKNEPLLSKLTLKLQPNLDVLEIQHFPDISPRLMALNKHGDTALIVEKHDNQNHLSMVNLTSFEKRLIDVSDSDFWGLTWHQEGESFWLGNESLRLVSIRGETETVYHPLGFISDLDLNPVTKQLAHTEGLINVNLYASQYEHIQTNGATSSKRLSSAARTDVLPTLSRDGTQTAFVSYQRRSQDGLNKAEIWLKNKYKKAATLLVNLPENIKPNYLLWSPNGENLLLGDQNYNLHLINVFSKHMVPVISSFQQVDAVNWTDDGKWLTFTASSDGLAQPWRYNLQTETTELVPTPSTSTNSDNKVNPLLTIKTINPSYRNFTKTLAGFLNNALADEPIADDLLPSLSLYRPYVFEHGIYYVHKQGHQLTLYRYEFASQENIELSPLGNHEQDVHLLLSLSSSQDGEHLVFTKLEEIETDIAVQRPVEANR